jgi:hypothetical protein
MQLDCQSTHESGSSRNDGGKERGSFGTNMSSEEDSEDSSTVQLAGQQTGLVVDKFVAHRGEARANKGVEKKVAMGIKGTSVLKKQKTAVKAAVKEVVQELIDEEDVEQKTKVRMDMELAVVALSMNSEPKHLTGTREETPFFIIRDH